MSNMKRNSTEYLTFIVLGLRGTSDADISLDHRCFWHLPRLLQEFIFLLL